MVKRLKKKARKKITKRKAIKKRRPVSKRRPLKRKLIRKKVQARRPKIKKSRAKKISPAKAKLRPPITGQFMGEITHFFSNAKAAVLTISAGELKLGDRIRIVGHTTDFEQEVASLQIDRQPIQVAKKGDEIGLAVKARVRQKDKVYKIS